MAGTLTKVFEQRGNFVREVHCGLAMVANYSTGGETIDISQAGLTRLRRMVIFPALGYTLEWDGSAATPKVIAYWVDTTVDGSPQLQVTAATDLSGITAARAILWGV